MEEILNGAGTAVADGAAAGGDAGGAGTGGGAGEGEGAGEGAGEKPGTGEGGAGGDGAGAGEGAGEGEGEGAGEIEGAAAGEGEGEGEGDEFESADGRKVDSKTREALAALKKVNPAAAKQLFADHGRAQAIVKEVGAQNLSDAVNKVRQITATLESVGGEEGLEGLQSEAEDYRNEIKQFSEGDPALLNQLHEANPDAFATSITNGLALIMEKSPAKLDAVLLPALVPRLQKAGMFDSVDQLAALIKEGKGQEAYDLTAKIKAWLDNAKHLSEKAATTRNNVDPRKEAQDKRDSELTAKEQKIYEGQIGSDVNKLNNTATARVVEPFFKDLKLKTEGRREFINALNSRIWKTMREDKAFQRAGNALKAKGDAGRTARFVSAKFVELLPEHFRALRDAMYPNYTRGGTKVAPGAGKANGAAGGVAGGGNGTGGGAGAGKAPAGVTLVTKMPKPEDIDWSKTTEEMYHVGRGNGEAILKSGKRLRWNWATVER
jgi:hypothetical protein